MFCKCGCNEEISGFDKRGRPHYYKFGHQNRKRYKKNLTIPENKNYCQCGCGQEIPWLNGNRNIIKFKTGHYSISDRQKTIFKEGEKHPKWKGGWIRKYGYIFTRKPDHPYSNGNGYIRTHRLIYEHYLKILFDEDIYIPVKWDIHHDNENREDNSLINLVPLPKNEHTILHYKRKNKLLDLKG